MDHTKYGSPETRRANLRRLRDSPRFNGNQSAMARMYGAAPSYFNDLLIGRKDKHGKAKPFGDKTARRAEEKFGILPGQLDIPNSPLQRDPTSETPLKEQILEAIATMDQGDVSEVMATIRKIQSRTRTSQRRTS